jgi:molybdopterin converting factor small subunit
MAVVIHLPGPLHPYAGGRDQVTLEDAPPTVADALRALWTRHPELESRVMTDDGRVRPHVNVFVGAESIRYTGGTATALRDGAEIFILPAVSGGSVPNMRKAKK